MRALRMKRQEQQPKMEFARPTGEIIQIKRLSREKRHIRKKGQEGGRRDVWKKGCLDNPSSDKAAGGGVWARVERAGKRK